MSSEFAMGTLAAQDKRSKYVGLYGARYLEGESETDLELWSALGTLLSRWSIWMAAPSTSIIDALRKGIKSTRFTNTPPGCSSVAIPGFRAVQARTTSGGIFRRASDWHGMWQAMAALGSASVGTFYDYPFHDLHARSEQRAAVESPVSSGTT